MDLFYQLLLVHPSISIRTTGCIYYSRTWVIYYHLHFIILLFTYLTSQQTVHTIYNNITFISSFVGAVGTGDISPVYSSYTSLFGAKCGANDDAKLYHHHYHYIYILYYNFHHILPYNLYIFHIIHILLLFHPFIYHIHL